MRQAALPIGEGLIHTATSVKSNHHMHATATRGALLSGLCRPESPSTKAAMAKLASVRERPN